MKVSLVIWMLALAGVSGVQSCDEKKEPDVLTQEEMVRYMTEIYIAEDKINRLSIGPDSSRRVFEKMRVKIEGRTGIRDSVFARSLQYYTQRPLQMEAIYTALVDSLNLKEQRSGQAQ